MNPLSGNQGAAFGPSAMTLLLRKSNTQAPIEGWVTGWADTDYTVLDGERIVGRIYREQLLGEQKWRWFLARRPTRRRSRITA